MLTLCSSNENYEDLVMKSKAVKQSPRDGDERQKPGGVKQPERQRTKKGPTDKPSQHPDKPQPVRSTKVAVAATSAAAVQQVASSRAPKPGASDQREALFNTGAVGTFKQIMVPTHEVTFVRGIMIDIDIECLRVGKVITEALVDGHDLYEKYVRGWLDNHPVLRKCEVLFTGRGLHCVLRFDKPVEIKSDRRRDLWNTAIRAIQRALPSDPEAPSLLAMTRPVGSINSKNGRRVELLRASEPVTELEVLQLAEDLTCRGFATFTQILFGASNVSPCPICRKSDSTLYGVAPKYRTSDPRITSRGSCYYCGKVPLVSLVDLVLKGRDDEDGDDTGEGAAETEVPPIDPDDQDTLFSTTAKGQGDE